MRNRAASIALIAALALGAAACDDTIEGVEQDVQEGAEEVQQELDDGGEE